MQILGLSDSTPKVESRLKSIFWPRVRYAEDVDLLGTQGYWICLIIAVFTVVVNLPRNNIAGGMLDAAFYYLAGVGIRRTSRFAAVSAFLIYFLGVIAGIKIAHSGGVVSIFFLALLLSNVRATWLAKRFASEQIALQQSGPGTVATPQSVFTDVLPRVIWPIGRWIYYVLAVLMFFGVAVLLFRTPTGSPF